MKDPRHDIQHVVVLMFENRSFDHLLGHLKHGGLVSIEDDPGVNRVDPDNLQSDACPSFPYKNDFDVHIDPGHTHGDITVQMQGKQPPLDGDRISMNGFVKNYLSRLPEESTDRVHRIMGWHTADQTPTLTQLARGYTVCSRWFSSVPGETWPNRMFVHSGHSRGLVANKPRPYGDRTVFDVLREHGKSWAVYAGDIPQAACYLNPLDLVHRRLVELDEFYDDVEANTLPAYSFIEPHHLVAVDSQHPDQSVYLGDQLLRRVYRALSSNPKIWDHLLFIVTWDEHGGFFDREFPPSAIPPVPGQVTDDENKFAFDQLGVRVPAVVISPWSAPESVVDTLFDHTSIARTVFEAFDIDDHLHDRDAAANSVLATLGAESHPPIPLDPVPSEALKAAKVSRAVAERGLTSTEELDGFQRSLLELKARMDQERGIPWWDDQSRDITEDAQTKLNRAVHQFRAEYVAPRGRRTALDHAP